jgi:aldehyde:ferredoxin oxidoreductase
MRYAETGFNLEIDLSRGTIERVETDPKLTELHLGGQGIAASEMEMSSALNRNAR